MRLQVGTSTLPPERWRPTHYDLIINTDVLTLLQGVNTIVSAAQD